MRADALAIGTTVLQIKEIPLQQGLVLEARLRTLPPPHGHTAKVGVAVLNLVTYGRCYKWTLRTLHTVHTLHTWHTYMATFWYASRSEWPIDIPRG